MSKRASASVSEHVSVEARETNVSARVHVSVGVNARTSVGVRVRLTSASVRKCGNACVSASALVHASACAKASVLSAKASVKKYKEGAKWAHALSRDHCVVAIQP